MQGIDIIGETRKFGKKAKSFKKALAGLSY
jgi:hypothetical protein